MDGFLNRNFLLDTPAAQRLYHEYAENMPIVDYHCHINPRTSGKTAVLRISPSFGSAATIINGG